MPLIVEDGSGVTGANTYDSLDNIKAFLASLGYSTANDIVEADVLRTMLFLESRAYQGCKTSEEYPLEFPRFGVGYYDSNEIPDRLKQALAIGCHYEHLVPFSLQPNLTRDDFLDSKNIAGAVSKTYSRNAPPAKRFQEIEALLSKLVKPGCRIDIGRA